MNTQDLKYSASVFRRFVNLGSRVYLDDEQGDNHRFSLSSDKATKAALTWQHTQNTHKEFLSSPQCARAISEGGGISCSTSPESLARGEMTSFLKALMALVWLLLLVASLVAAIVCIVMGQVLAAGMLLVFFVALVGIGFI
jgi:hypothetical protein